MKDPKFTQYYDYQKKLKIGVEISSGTVKIRKHVILIGWFFLITTILSGSIYILTDVAQAYSRLKEHPVAIGIVISISLVWISVKVIASIGLLKMIYWARKLIIALLCINFAIYAISFAFSQDPSHIIHIIINGVIAALFITYLIRPEVVAVFKARNTIGDNG